MALAVYALFAVILLHPLWVYNGTHAAGYDYFNYNWTFWWIRHALTTPGLNVYENNFVMFPAMSNYGYHALSAFWYPVWALLEPLIGTLTAVNVIITLGCVLNGYLLFVWLRSEGIAPRWALAGGILLQTLPLARYWYYNTHLNLMDWFWLPGLLLLWKRVVGVEHGVQGKGLNHRGTEVTEGERGKSSRESAGRPLWMTVLRAVIFGVALWGLLLTDLQFPIFAAFVLVPYGLLTLVWAARAGGWTLGRFVLGSVVAVGVGGALMWFAGPLSYIVRFSGALIPGPVEDRPGIPFPSGFLSMAERWWSWDSPSLGAFFFPALLVTLVVALTQRRRVRPLAWFWLLVALPPLVLALGPHLQIGEARLPLPFVWMYDLTNGNFRMPWRLAPAGVIAAAAFMGMVWTDVARLVTKTSVGPWTRAIVWHRAGMALVLLWLLAGVRLFETGPIESVLPDYATYRAMGQEGHDYVVLQAPTGMGTGEVLLGNARAIQYQWYGLFHEQRMVNGFISRAPVENFFYVETGDALLSWLGQRRYLEVEAAQARLLEMVEAEMPLGYLVVHGDDIGVNSMALGEIIGFLNLQTPLLCPPVIEGAALFYRTQAHPEGCGLRTPIQTETGTYVIDIGAAGDAAYLGWGWHYAEPVGGVDWRWAGAFPRFGAEDVGADFDYAEIIVDLPPEDYRLSAQMQSFGETRALQIRVNGVDTGVIWEVLPSGLATFAADIPAALIGDGRNVQIRFEYDVAGVPAETGQGGDERRLVIAVERIILEQLEN
jgi:hypothetical protein